MGNIFVKNLPSGCRQLKSNQPVIQPSPSTVFWVMLSTDPSHKRKRNPAGNKSLKRLLEIVVGPTHLSTKYLHLWNFLWIEKREPDWFFVPSFEDDPEISRPDLKFLLTISVQVLSETANILFFFGLKVINFILRRTGKDIFSLGIHFSGMISQNKWQCLLVPEVVSAAASPTQQKQSPCASDSCVGHRSLVHDRLVSWYLSSWFILQGPSD